MRKKKVKNVVDDLAGVIWGVEKSDVLNEDRFDWRVEEFSTFVYSYEGRRDKILERITINWRITVRFVGGLTR